MNLALVVTVLQRLVSFSFAGTLPHNWKEFIDSDILKDSDNDQSPYSSEKWEGDISNFEPGERPSNVAANAVDKPDLIWPNNTIPYAFTTEQSVRFRVTERTRITEAMEIIMHLTGKCVKFVERTSETDYIKFQKGYQCYSDVGRTGSKQVVSLSSTCAERYGCIQHELMHVLGFYHEQSRSDRDDYITINWDNIATENKLQFALQEGATYGLPYDYESVMHYQFNAFAVDDQLPTILPKVRKARLGQKENLSPLDITRIHKRLKCSIPSGKNFLVSRTKEIEELKEADIPMSATLDHFPVFSTEPMTQEQCEYQYSANCAHRYLAKKTCQATETLDINCDRQVTSAQLHDMAMNMSKGPLRPISVWMFDGDKLRLNNFLAIRKQIIRLTVEICLSNRTTGKLAQLRFSNLLSFELHDCYKMEIRRSDFARSIRLRKVALWNTTIEELEKEAFTDLTALMLLSLENGFSYGPYTEHVRSYLRRLHCSCEFSWFRRWLNYNPHLLQARERETIYGTPYSWAWNRIYVPIDCSSVPFFSDYKSIDFTQERYSINDYSDSEGEESGCKNTHSEALATFPVFSPDPMTAEQCALQFSSNCAPTGGLTRSNCTTFKNIDIKCNASATPEEIRKILTAIGKTAPRPTLVELHDDLTVSFANFAPVRDQVIIFTLRHCRDSRGTGKPYELRTVNLLHLVFVYCYKLSIMKKDFQRATKLRVIELDRSTILTLETGTFGDLPSLRVLALEYGLANIPLFSTEIREYIFRLHCSCEFAWYRQWWENSTALVRTADTGTIYVINGYRSPDYAREEIYIPVDCSTPPTGSASIKTNQIEFSINVIKCP